MSNKSLRHIIILGGIVITCLMVVQLFWMKRAFDIRDKQFNHSVQVALMSIADSLVHNNHDSPTIKQLANGFFFAELNVPIDPGTLDSLIKREFAIRSLRASYELGIYNAYDDTLVYGEYIPASVKWDLEHGNSLNDKTCAEIPKSNFAIYFPHKTSYLAGELKIWIFSTIVLLFVVLFFIYAILSILKERKLSEIKEDFLNNMTHEFKTPIANIGIASDLLRSDKLQESKKYKYLEIIAHENKKLKAQIDRVLRMGAIDKDNLDLSIEDIDIHKLLRQLATNLSIRLQKNSGEIYLDLNATNTLIHGDEFHLANAVYNILDNAEKYSNGVPNIKVITKNHNNGILISILDKGIGIKKDLQKHIFDKFFRVPTGNTHNVKGFGLGLFYSKTVIAAHKGAVALESDPGQGSRFDIFLPY